MKKVKFTHEEEQVIRKLYSSTSTFCVASLLGKDVKSIYSKAGRLRLKKTHSFLSKSISKRFKGKPNKGAFKHEHTPFNKGKRQTDFMSNEAIERTKQTRFKKGDNPHNTKSNGALSARKDKKTGISYIYIRISKANWQAYHRYIWEQHHKETLSFTDNIIFINGNQLDVQIDNLKKISCSELMKINSIYNKPKEYQEVKRMITKMNKLIKILENGKQ